MLYMSPQISYNIELPQKIMYVHIYTRNMFIYISVDILIRASTTKPLGIPTKQVSCKYGGYIRRLKMMVSKRHSMMQWLLKGQGRVYP